MLATPETSVACFLFPRVVRFYPKVQFAACRKCDTARQKQSSSGIY